MLRLYDKKTRQSLVESTRQDIRNKMDLWALYKSMADSDNREFLLEHITQTKSLYPENESVFETMTKNLGGDYDALEEVKKKIIQADSQSPGFICLKQSMQEYTDTRCNISLAENIICSGVIGFAVFGFGIAMCSITLP